MYVILNGVKHNQCYNLTTMIQVVDIVIHTSIVMSTFMQLVHSETDGLNVYRIKHYA